MSSRRWVARSRTAPGYDPKAGMTRPGSPRSSRMSLRRRRPPWGGLPVAVGVPQDAEDHHAGSGSGDAALSPERTNSHPGRPHPHRCVSRRSRSVDRVAPFYRVIGIWTHDPALHLLPRVTQAHQHPAQALRAHTLGQHSLLPRHLRKSRHAPYRAGHVIRLWRLPQHLLQTLQRLGSHSPLQGFGTWMLPGADAVQTRGVEGPQNAAHAFDVKTQHDGDIGCSRPLRGRRDDLTVPRPRAIRGAQPPPHFLRFLRAQGASVDCHPPSIQPLTQRNINHELLH